MLKTFGAAAVLMLAPAAHADNEVLVVGGQTSVLLNTAALSDLASLDLSGVTSNVIVPGEIEGSVAFPINERGTKGELLPTSFGFDLGNFLGSFFGAIEHEGSVLFNNDTVEVGNFTIGFDATRITKDASGFFVESTVGIPAILFDVANPSELAAKGDGVVIGADLLVSPEFAGFLVDNGLAKLDLTGADVGDALFEGDVGCTAADTNDDGRVSGRDFFRYLFQFVTGRDAADFDGDGFLTGPDVRAFFQAFGPCTRGR
ncbi:MAG: GC-type dockerin domain-anchored protein [Planctomycetota bacterium]